VILCDDLVDRRVLRHARSDAEVVSVGKRGDARERDRQQEAIHERMIREARAGRTVVRLKGGDPFVFGRGGEEAERLVAAGIPFEVVPGVSSAVAVPAYAGIPVTHRGLNSAFSVATGREAPGREGSIDWEALARSETVVLLMAVKRLPEVVARLLAAGKAPDTPAACIRNGTRPDQKTVVAPLAELPERVRGFGLGPPGIVVVGEVVRLRERLAWFERRPLAGRRILVTRAAEQAGELRDRLEALGAEAIEAPAIRLAPPESFEALDGALGELERFDWIVFTSVNGVERFFERLFAKERDLRALGRARLAAIGPATAEALRRRGLRADIVPQDDRAEGLAAELAPHVRGSRVLLARAAEARSVLPEELSRAGAEVADVPVYRTLRADRLPPEARRTLACGALDAVTFTSPSTVRGLLELLRAEGLELGRAKVACIGPVTADAARELGLRVDIEARPYTLEALVDALAKSFSPIEP
jgi:uroporphyrinogen III methyltransferase/synthase